MFVQHNGLIGTFRSDSLAGEGKTVKDVSIKIKYHYPAMWRSVFFI